MHPDDFAKHDCITMRFVQYLDREWPSVVDGAVRNVAVKGRRVANGGEP